MFVFGCVDTSCRSYLYANNCFPAVQPSDRPTTPFTREHTYPTRDRTKADARDDNHSPHAELR